MLVHRQKWVIDLLGNSLTWYFVVWFWCVWAMILFTYFFVLKMPQPSLCCMSQKMLHGLLQNSWHWDHSRVTFVYTFKLSLMCDYLESGERFGKILSWRQEVYWLPQVGPVRHCGLIPSRAGTETIQNGPQACPAFCWVGDWELFLWE